MSKKIFYGWREIFLNFDHQATRSEKIFNVFMAFGFSVIWMLIISIGRIMFGGTHAVEADSLWISKYLGQFLIQTGLADEVQIVIRVIFMAPLVEEPLFRWFPIFILVALSGQYGRRLVLEGVIFSSIIFGLMHGSVWNVLLQGVLGIVFCWVYLKNNLSRWSPVIVHSLYNMVTIIFVVVSKAPSLLGGNF